MATLDTTGLNVQRGLPARGKKLVDTVLVPIVAADIITGDSDILSLLFVNVGGQPNPKVTLTDDAGMSFVFYAAPVSPGFPLGYEKPDGLRCTGKLTWVCDTASAVEGKIEYRSA